MTIIFVWWRSQQKLGDGSILSESYQVQALDWENIEFPAYPFIEMVASFISRNLCRPYLYQTVGLALVRESDTELVRLSSPNDYLLATRIRWGVQSLLLCLGLRSTALQTRVPDFRF
ncbi:hypothetical protein [Microcoleus sp. BROC3]|uniref:hypothetical protein n=1 Tax=Microcoleus sp. BROC3 TaxID=3055323 RepID=UPI002FD4F288